MSAPRVRPTLSLPTTSGWTKKHPKLLAKTYDTDESLTDDDSEDEENPTIRLMTNRPIYRSSLITLSPTIRAKVRVDGYVKWFKAFILLDSKIEDSIICDQFLGKIGGYVYAPNSTIQVLTNNKGIKNEAMYPMPMKVSTWSLHKKTFECLTRQHLANSEFCETRIINIVFGRKMIHSLTYMPTNLVAVNKNIEFSRTREFGLIMRGSLVAADLKGGKEFSPPLILESIPHIAPPAFFQ